MIQITQYLREAGGSLLRLGCTCAQPDLALYPCEDDQLLFCTHCGAITTGERLLNDSSLPQIPPPVQWLNVHDHAECPLINVSIPLTVRAAGGAAGRPALGLTGVITKISAEKCFVRIEGGHGCDVLQRRQEVELASDQPPLAGRLPAVVEDILAPHGPGGPAYFKIRFVPVTLDQKSALEEFFQATCGLQFEARLLLYTPDHAFSHLRRRIRDGFPRARVLKAASEDECLRLAGQFAPEFCLLPLLPPLLERLGYRHGQAHPPGRQLILLLKERDQAAIREALLWGAAEILHPDSGREAISRAIQRGREIKTQDLIPAASGPVFGAPAAGGAQPGDPLGTVARPRPSISEEDAVRLLCMASETHDAHSSNHLNRIAAYTAALARRLGLAPGQVAMLATASKLHDVGKMGVPDNILRKTGHLTADERRLMQEHTRFGHRILQASGSELMRLGATIALRHHERHDGGGYPDGLAGEQVPLEARIVTVADVFDALTTQRAYKPAWSNEKAAEHLQEEAGRMFAPEVVETFLHVLPEIEQIQLRFLDDFRDVWTERRRDPRIPVPGVPVTLELVMPELTFLPRRIAGQVQNLSRGGAKVLLQGISQDFFTLLVSARRYAKLSCRHAEWRPLDLVFCGVSWVDYYAVPDADECLMGLSFQKAPAGLEELLCRLAS